MAILWMHLQGVMGGQGMGRVLQRHAYVGRRGPENYALSAALDYGHHRRPFCEDEATLGVRRWECSKYHFLKDRYKFKAQSPHRACIAIHPRRP